MPNPIFNQPLDRKVPACESPAIEEINQRLASLKKSHSMLYRMIDLETWAIVRTMEDFAPGFWSRFMANRQLAFQRFLAQKKVKRF